MTTTTIICGRHHSPGWRLCSVGLILVIMCIILPYCRTQLMTCPQVCSCIWRNGKQTTICENQNLISIPNQISPSTQVLDLNNNNFQILPSKAFQERALINLQKLFLPHCKLGAIADDAFYQLTNLVELDLSDNLLTHVPVKALANATNLRRLLLNNNHIATISAESFAALSSLKFLNLSGCKTHTIETRAFYGLKDLEYLYLHNNQLTSLPYSVVADLPALYSFELYKNPWQCNCEMRQTREWMIRNNVGQSIPPTCDQPIRLSGLMWNSLDLDDFACQPDIISTTVEVAKLVGSNATLSCLVKGVPEPKIFWYLEQGYYNISSSQHSQRLSQKYQVSEERTESTVTSLLTIVSLDLADDATTFICSAENRAGIKSKNFTLFVLPSAAFGVAANWSKVELAGGVLGLLITLFLVFVVITLILIRLKRFSMKSNCIKSNNDKKDQNSPKKSLAGPLAKILPISSNKSNLTNTSQVYPSTNGTSAINYGMQQHLSMLGLDGIDKKPEIFLPPDLVGQQQPSAAMVQNNANRGLLATPGYEMNHFKAHQKPNVLSYLPDFHEQPQQDTLFIDESSQLQLVTKMEPNSGLYRAVMVAPSVLTNSNQTMLSGAPQTNSSTVTTTTSISTSAMGHATSPTLMLSVPNLYQQQKQYDLCTSQFDLNDQTNQQPSIYHQNGQLGPQHFQMNRNMIAGNSSTSTSSGAPSPLTLYAQSATNAHRIVYNKDNSLADDDDVFATNQFHVTSTLDGSPLPSALLLRQTPSANQPLFMVQTNEPIYEINRATILPQVATPPMQMAPPTPININNHSIYGVSTKNGWTPSQHLYGQQQQHVAQPSQSRHLATATSLSNIRCSPDEGYGEESSNGPSVGHLEGTEV